MVCFQKKEANYKLIPGLTSEVRCARSARAVACTRDGLAQPKVDICVDEYGGIGLYASEDFHANEQIFVERALVATVVQGSVRACGLCCRSLVAIDEIILKREPTQIERDAWPVPVPGGRCKYCDTWFCQQCEHDPYCCAVKASLNALGSMDVNNPPAAALLSAVISARPSLKVEFDHSSLCGKIKDTYELGLEKYLGALCNKEGNNDLTSLLAQTALNAFEVKLASPFDALYHQLASRYGRGSKKLHAALSELKIAMGCSPNDVDDVLGQRCANTCAGVFTLASCINHDCKPNCFASGGFNEPQVEIIAGVDIPKGTELTLSYIKTFARDGASWSNEPREIKRRRTQLQRCYLFHCQCDLCSDHEILI
uniref:SET domain-containing protein n=1 Tax=Aureoumbra lagunensis TaxID=44058 RepID=A0A7S3K496_9STRA